MLPEAISGSPVWVDFSVFLALRTFYSLPQNLLFCDVI